MAQYIYIFFLLFECVAYLLHVTKSDGLRPIAGVAPALARVPPGARHSGGGLSQPVKQRHLLRQAERAEVRLLTGLRLILH